MRQTSLLLAIAWCLAAAGIGSAVERPNIVLIMTDQMRGQAMGVAGDPNVRTPNIDALAAGGIYLPNTIANNPVCSPARATILTGTYPHGHGVIINDLRLAEDSLALSKVLADQGYATAFVGKWHLDGGHRLPGFVPPGPRRQGFAYWAANECNHNHFNSFYFRDDDTPIPIEKFETEVWMDETIRFIRANRDQPFFVWYACGPPHNPYAAPPEFERLYDPETITLRPNWQEGTRWGSREDIAKYYAAITAIDVEVGRLMRVLDELELTEDTIVLFTSDHGDMLGSQGLPFKSKPHAESIVVPGVVHYPRRIEPGRRSDLLFSHVDFMPTFLALCGLEVPEELHGRDLSPYLTGQRPSDAEGPEAVYLQQYEPRHWTDVPEAWRGVRTKRYTYARFEEEPWVLFDIENDPYEMNNLAEDPAYADLRARFDAMIAAEMARTGDDWSLNRPEEIIMHTRPASYVPADR